jgi:hypothetical protein
MKLTYPIAGRTAVRIQEANEITAGYRRPLIPHRGRATFQFTGHLKRALVSKGPRVAQPLGFSRENIIPFQAARNLKRRAYAKMATFLPF